MKQKILSLLSLVLAITMLGACSNNTQTQESSPISVSESQSESVSESQPEVSSEADSKTVVVTDSIGREVELPSSGVKAVVSNAYNMELVNAIGAAEQVVGVDWYIWQDAESWKGRFTEEMEVGKDPEMNYEKIISLSPDVLVLAENGGWEDAQQSLEPFGIKVFVCNAYYTAEFANNCEMLGQVFNVQDRAKELSDYFTEKLDYIDTQLKDVPKKTVYFEYRTIGRTTVPGDYFFNMIEFAHADNIFKDAEARDVDPEAVIAANPEYIVKVSAPDVTSSYYPPTLEEHQAIKDELKGRPGWDETLAVKNDNILLLSHYVQGGASKLVGTMYVAKYMYPDQLPDLNPEQVFSDWLVKFMGNEYIEGHTLPAYATAD